MAVQDHMKPGYGSRRACTITTVHPKTRKIEAALKDQTVVQIAVFDTREFFVWPKVGESWIIQQANGIWVLDRRADSTDDVKINDLAPGHGKIAADVVKTPTGKSVVITDDTNAANNALLSYIDETWQPSIDLKINSLSVTEKVILESGAQISTTSQTGTLGTGRLELIETQNSRYIILDGGTGKINLAAANPTDLTPEALAKKSSIVFDNNGLIQFSKQGTIEFKSLASIRLNSSTSENTSSTVAGEIFIGASNTASITFYKTPKIQINDQLVIDDSVTIYGDISANDLNISNIDTTNISASGNITASNYVKAINDMYVGASNTIHLEGNDGSASFQGDVYLKNGETNKIHLYASNGNANFQGTITTNDFTSTQGITTGGLNTSGGNVVTANGGIDAGSGNIRGGAFYIGSGTSNPLATQSYVTSNSSNVGTAYKNDANPNNNVEGVQSNAIWRKVDFDPSGASDICRYYELTIPLSIGTTTSGFVTFPRGLAGGHYDNSGGFNPPDEYDPISNSANYGAQYFRLAGTFPLLCGAGKNVSGNLFYWIWNPTSDNFVGYGTLKITLTVLIP